MSLISFYVPSKHAEKVKEKMFEAGAGTIGNYTKCSFESLGLGQFLPMNDSRPAIGTVGVLEKVEELKVEMICKDSALKAALEALMASHPYETPVYYVTQLVGL